MRVCCFMMFFHGPFLSMMFHDAVICYVVFFETGSGEVQKRCFNGCNVVP